MPVHSVFINTHALAEARRCLQCDDPPCANACPAGIPVVSLVRHLLAGSMRAAWQELVAANAMAATCGALCPSEAFCRSACVLAEADRAVDVRAIHRAVTEWARRTWISTPRRCAPTGKKVAIVGGGPAGLGCACAMGAVGHEVTIFERGRQLGGVLRSTVVPWRIGWELDADGALAAVGSGVVTGAEIGDLADLPAGFDAVFLSPGLSRSCTLEIPGEEGVGVWGGLEFLSSYRDAHKAPWDKAVILGGGNVAMDAGRLLRRLGVKGVTVLYRRHRAQMPAWPEIVREAENDGVVVEFLRQPIRVEGEAGRVQGVVCSPTELGDPGPDGRPSVRVAAETELRYPAQAVVVATGQELPESFFPSVCRSSEGLLRVSETGATEAEGIYAGGDATRGGGSVVEAVADGMRAARAIDGFLRNGGTLQD
jgi:NADPH-dependent glutamate synthase beta subunit-like oxidoreductase